MKLSLLWLLFICLFLTPYTYPLAEIFRLELGNTELILEFDPFYMPLGWFAPLTGTPIPQLELESEGGVYWELLTRFLSFRFMVLEFSAYPFPLLGVGIRHWTPDFYYSTTIFPGFNLVESITTGVFKEPYAVSLFLGQVVNFTSPEIVQANIKELQSSNNATNETNIIENGTLTEKQYQGKGLSGFLISYGSHHIRKNVLIPDHWLELEMKLKGERVKPGWSISFSYRFGARIHFNPLIKSYIYLGIKREHFDMNFYRFTFIHNSFIEMSISMDIEQWQFLKFVIMYGKKFPIPNFLLVPEINIGFEWNITQPYTGSLVDAELTEFVLLVTPSLRF